MPIPEVVDEGKGIEHSIEEDTKFLSEGEEKVPEKVVEEVEEPEEKIEEIKEPGEKPEEIKTEEIPTFTQIKEKYPNLFKDFPQLREMYFKEHEFEKLFTSVDEAKQVVEESQALSEVRDSVLNGDASTFLDAIKSADESALKKLSSNFLTSLYKISPDAHLAAVTPLLESIVRSAYIEGQEGKNENLVNAALVIAHHLFGKEYKTVVSGERRISREPDEERAKFEQEKKEFLTTKFNDFSGSVTSEARTNLTKIVNDNFDPDGVFSPGLTKMLTQQIINEVDQSLAADKSHIIYMDSLWSRAVKAGFQGDWKQRIVSAYLARAKSLVPVVRNRIREDALGTKSKDNDNKISRAENVSARKELSQGRVSQISSSIPDSKRIDYKNTSDLDIIEGNFKLKK